MTILQNMKYNKVVSTVALATITSFTSVSSIHANESLVNLEQKASYDKYIDYTYTKQSTVDGSSLKNDKKMIKNMEIFEIEKIIKSKYGVKITNIWLPADNTLEKICLFVTLENQKELVSKTKDFELDLYLTLEDKLKQSQLFNMIALI